MNIKQIASGRRDMFMVDPRKLVIKPGFNLREEGPELDEYIEALANYIMSNGVPGVLLIEMQGDEPVVIDGHCRTIASLIAIERGAELKSVSCRMMDKYATEADRIACLITENSHRQITPIEKAGIAKRLHKLNLSNNEIANKLGMTAAYVGQLLELSGAPEYVAEMVKAGEVSASTAMQEVKKNPETAKERLTAAVKTAKAAGKKKATKKHIAPSPGEVRRTRIDRAKNFISGLDKRGMEEILDHTKACLKEKSK